jgi:hypothetical protein
MIAVLAFWLLFLTFVAAFAVQVTKRVRLIAAAPGALPLDNLGGRIRRWLVDVLFQVRTIHERPLPGVAHALVFWGFLAFAGYTTVEFAGARPCRPDRHAVVLGLSDGAGAFRRRRADRDRPPRDPPGRVPARGARSDGFG